MRWSHRIPGQTHPEQHFSYSGERLNWLRASVLGANDGIVSIAGLVFGVMGAMGSTSVIAATGIAGIIAGAISMAVGEYVSVSGSRDAERALILKEKGELEAYPEAELSELTALYEKKGLRKDTASLVAKELTAKDAFAAHAEAELKIDPLHLVNPYHAALASAVSFLLGAIIPLLAILLPPVSIRVPVAFLSVIIVLAFTGALSAYVGGANILRASSRIVIGGVVAMVVTYAVGVLFQVSIQ